LSPTGPGAGDCDAGWVGAEGKSGSSFKEPHPLSKPTESSKLPPKTKREIKVMTG